MGRDARWTPRQLEQEDHQRDPCQPQYQERVNPYNGAANVEHDEANARSQQDEKREKRRVRHGRGGSRSACRSSGRGWCLVTEVSGR